MPENIYAHTASGTDYPEFISVNETDDPETITVLVRSPRKEDGACGDTAQIALTMGQADELAGAVLRVLHRRITDRALKRAV